VGDYLTKASMLNDMPNKKTSDQNMGAVTACRYVIASVLPLSNKAARILRLSRIARRRANPLKRHKAKPERSGNNLMIRYPVRPDAFNGRDYQAHKWRDCASSHMPLGGIR
jgi:hypothetical protein